MDLGTNSGVKKLVTVLVLLLLAGLLFYFFMRAYLTFAMV
ncbi:MAG: hypothetical protein DDT40_01592 [candidate division WS2 bacterium]|nr:hypothetical protein [Bacillota bacterium]MBT9151399.1 hypothetical protein [Candidatus Psychracetigena formicireducens]